MKGKRVTVILSAALAVLIISFAIGLPIYFRPFYYMQIGPLGLREVSGLSYGEIREAYDELLDYLTLPFADYGMGKLHGGAKSIGHFADVKVLFMINASLFLASLLTVTVILVLVKKKKVTLERFRQLGFEYWTGKYMLIGALVLGLIVLLNFEAAFEAFHSFMFPGKTDWRFEGGTDQIIRILPAEFFMSCAGLIFAVIILSALALVIIGVVRKKRRLARLHALYEEEQKARRSAEDT